MLYSSIPELITEAAQLVPTIKTAGVVATSERLNALQDKTIVVKYGGNAMTDVTLQQQCASVRDGCGCGGGAWRRPTD